MADMAESLVGAKIEAERKPGSRGLKTRVGMQAPTHGPSRTCESLTRASCKKNEGYKEKKGRR